MRKDIPDGSWKQLAHSMQERLCEQQKLLRSFRLAAVDILFRIGAPVSVLAGEGTAQKARLLVVGMPAQRERHLWPRATVAEEAAESAAIPTLVVSNAAPFLDWIRNERRLRVFVAADLSDTSENALRWVEWLRNVGPCDIIAAHLAADAASLPAAEAVPSLFLGEMVSKAAHTEERLFDDHMRARFGLAHVRIRTEPETHQSGAKLVGLAARERADLIVMGTHSRQGWRRLGHHSISREVLRYASTNVLICPNQGGNGA